MKIAIIGAGTASAISALSLYSVLIDNKAENDVEVVCFSDPSIPITQVGESTSVIVPILMQKVIYAEFPSCLTEFDGTVRDSSRHIWTQANDTVFAVAYGAPGLHVNSEKFSNYIFTRLPLLQTSFRKLELAVTSLVQDKAGVTINNKYTFDFVIDCRGTPSDDELAGIEYAEPTYGFVNSVILYPEYKSYNEDYTSAHVHNNGWMFGVPLQHRKAWGYLYNNTLTSQETARSEFNTLKPASDATRNFSWKQYYKIDAIDNRVLSMGNKLYFFEPTQAIPLHYYAMLTLEFARKVYSTLDIPDLNSAINEFHLNNMSDIQDLIAISYCGESKIKSTFWTTAKEQATHRLQNSNRFQEWIQKKETAKRYVEFWAHTDYTMKQYIEGFKVDLSKLKK